MTKIEQALREECLEHPEENRPVVVTVKDGFDPAVVEGLGLSEIPGMNIFCGTIDGKTVLSLSEEKDIINIERDLEASISAG